MKLLILFAQHFIVPVLAQTISYDPASPRQSYAVARLQEALTAADQKTAKSNKPFHINLRIDKSATTGRGICYPT